MTLKNSHEYFAMVVQWNLRNQDTAKQTTSLKWTPSDGPKCLILYENDLVNQTTSLIRTLFRDPTGGLISEVLIRTLFRDPTGGLISEVPLNKSFDKMALRI